jgi:signal transduction histidine kinase
LVGIIIDIEATREVNDGSRGPLITTERAEPGDVLVAVRDLGLGVKPEHLKQAFDAFYTPEPGGMGMRLATSRSIINSHGGPPVDDTERPAGSYLPIHGACSLSLSCRR